MAIWAYLTGQQISLADETSEISTIFNSLAASFERRKASQRVTDALRRRAERGQVAGGKAPYGYEQYKDGDVVKRRIREDQAVIVKRIFTDTANGIGLTRIAKALNKEHISAPTPKGTKLYRNGVWTEATGEWSPTAVAEILHQRRFLGIEVYGRTKRVKRRGSTKGRVASPDRVIEAKVPELAIIDQDLWGRAHAAKNSRRAALLRDGKGKLQGQRESLTGRYLLSNHLACGGRRPDGVICGAPLTIVKRGTNLVLSYACRARQANGETACDNGTAVPAETLHAGVVMALQGAFTPERFEQHLRDLAGDDEARARRTAERERLIQRVPQISLEESNITRAIAAGGELEPLVARLKALKAERQDVEARMAELEADERDLAESTAAAERLREQWADWVQALDAAAAGPVPETALQVARQILRKVLHMVIYVVPDGRNAWNFFSAASVDGNAQQVRGRASRDVATAILKLPGGGLRFVSREIAGGSDAPDDPRGGLVRGEDMAPQTPQGGSERPGGAVALLDTLTLPDRRGAFIAWPDAW